MEKELIAMEPVVGCCNVDARKQLLQRAQVDLDAFMALVHAVETAECDLSALQTASSKLSPKEVQGHTVPWQRAKATIDTVPMQTSASRVVQRQTTKPTNSPSAMTPPAPARGAQVALAVEKWVIGTGLINAQH